MKKSVFSFFCFLLLCFLSTDVISGQIGTVFSDSVFGVKWTDSVSEVEDKIKGGSLSNQYGYITYKVPDGREVLKTKRSEKDNIIFTFNSEEKLMGVSVELPMKDTSDFGDLQNKLTTYFGSPAAVPNQAGVIHMRWPEDELITLSLTVIPSGFMGNKLMLGIEKQAQVSTTKKELGF